MSTLEELFQQVERTLRDNEAAREAFRRHSVQRQAELRESKIKVDQAVKRLRRAGLLK
jgi:hypothetical protein